MLSNVDGSWVGFVDFDKVRYWDVRTTEKMTMSKPKDLLPSDSTFRLDRKPFFCMVQVRFLRF